MKANEMTTVEESKFHIPADVVNYDDRVKVLNHFDTFAIFDRWGDVHPHGKKAQGIFHYGTRYINRLELRLNGKKPLLLSSSIKEDNDILSVDLTNPDLTTCNIQENSLHISRSHFLRNGIYYEEIKFVNYGEEPCQFEISLTFGADFKDIFEVRGICRQVEVNKPVLTTSKKKICYDYRGLDQLNRQTEVNFTNVDDTLEIHHNQARISLELSPHESHTLNYFIRFKTEEEFFAPDEKQKMTVGDAKELMHQHIQDTRALFASIQTSHEQFNHWIERSQADLISLLTETPYGNYPYAGIPWYNTAFGRDGIITAMEVLWVAPEIARDALFFLSRLQATQLIAEKDAEPGKIIHETRSGEMANTGEVPFGEYYGTIDATPLYLMLAGRYFRRTGDVATIRSIWPHLIAALKWIDEYGDIDKDGFVEYKHKAENGLTNQGWKDSHDSVMYANGELAEPPIALCEVQGYVYAAKKSMAELARAMGDDKLSHQLEGEADWLKAAFNQSFWDEKIGAYVLALDGDKKPCSVVSSNAGHCLFTGIAEPEKAALLAKQLMADSMFTGWGIRTLSTDARRYNPMSYHNGSVWPHDNAMISYGFARYGMQHYALQVMEAMFDASLYIEMQRLPELFCGFERRPGEGPTAYPVACSPQAWSVGAVYMMLEACLQIKIDAHKKQLIFNNPVLPQYLDKVVVRDLELDSGHCDFELYRNPHNVSINVLHKPEGWELLIRK